MAPVNGLKNLNLFENPSRREFLRTGLGVSGALWNKPSWLHELLESDDTRIEQALSKTIGVDMHNHVYPPGTEPHPQWGPSQAGTPPPAQMPELSLSREIKKSGLTAVCASYVLDFASNVKPGDARANYLAWLAAMDAQLEKGNIRRALKSGDIESSKKKDEPIIVQTVEGAHFIEGQVARLEEVYKRGLRHLQLLHDKDDMLKPLGDTVTSKTHLGGLTPFGAEVVKECNRLGILVDMAHASHETVLGVLKVSTKPILISHTNLDSWTGSNLQTAEMMKPRLISKAHAQVVADAGGVVGVWTHLTDSPKQFVESIKVMSDAIGIDHVGMGTDTDLLSSRAGSGTNEAWAGLSGGFFPAVVREMIAEGFTTDEIIKIGGGNYCRIFDGAMS